MRKRSLMLLCSVWIIVTVLLSACAPTLSAVKTRTFTSKYFVLECRQEDYTTVLWGDHIGIYEFVNDPDTYAECKDYVKDNLEATISEYKKGDEVYFVVESIKHYKY